MVHYSIKKNLDYAIKNGTLFDCLELCSIKIEILKFNSFKGSLKIEKKKDKILVQISSQSSHKCEMIKTLI